MRYLAVFATLALLYTSTPTRADYVIIRVFSKPPGGTGQNNGAMNGGFNGMGIGGGQIGMPGGMNGMPQGGFRGIQGGPMPPGGFMGGGGFGIQGGPVPPGGFQGAQGGPVPPGGFMGGGGGFQGGPAPPGGFQGVQGGPVPPGMGAQGGIPGNGFRGGMGNGIGGGNPGGVMDMVDDSISEDDYVTVAVEINKTHSLNVANMPMIMMDTKYGSTARYEDPKEVHLQYIPKKILKNPADQFIERHKALMNTPAKEKTPDRYLELARWCLRVGLPDKCREMLNETQKFIDSGGKGASITVTPEVSAALAAYKNITSILDADIAKNKKATVWKERLKYGNMTIRKHYALVHNSENPQKDGIDRRLDALENNFKSFYLLFAIKGKALPAPSEKLVALLLNDPKTFLTQKDIFNVGHLVSDGFYARQENLAIFSPTRLDIASKNFTAMMREVYRTSETDLLTGKFPDLGAKDKAPRKATAVARAQILALVERALREESEIASATHEGTLQLIEATGLLPRNVPAPKWLRFGMASIFEMPKGPFPGTRKSMARIAFWPGAGGPNWAWRLYFDEMQQHGKISDQPTDLLYKTITDVYFNMGDKLKAIEKGLDIDVDLHSNFMAEAHTLSWALTYYLFNERFKEFENYLARFSTLPRDIEMDDYTSVTMFLSAFGYNTSGLTATDPKGNLERYNPLAKAWVSSIRSDQAPTVELNIEGVSQSQTNPGNIQGNGNGFQNGGGFQGGGFPGGPNGGGFPGGPNGGFQGGFPNGGQGMPQPGGGRGGFPRPRR